MNGDKLIISCIFFICSIGVLFAQSYNDGPISVDVKLREVQGNFAATDESLLGIGFAPDELTFKIWVQDNLLTYPWTGGSCLQDNNFTPTVGGSNSIDFNTIFANFSFTMSTVPQYLDFKVDTWEDDLPSDGLAGFCTNGTACTWQDIQCCGVQITWPFTACLGIETGDDYRCDADPFYQGLTYRSGPPCQWYSHGYLNGSGCSDASINGYYKPHIETFWRYTKGTSFSNAIDLGTLTMGTPITHFNSNECYTDYYTSSSGNDVIYSFNVTSSTGANISLCGMNGAQFDSYLYLVKDTTMIALSENNDYCSNQSELSTALCEPGTYYVVVDATSPSELGTFTLTITEDPSNSFSATNVVTDVSCNAGNDGKINSILSGGFSPFSFSWFDVNMNILSSNPPSSSIEDSLENLSASNYILQVIDNNNCIIIDTILVNEPAPLSFVTSQIPTSCNGVSDGQVHVTVSGGTQNYSYIWNTNPVQNNANAVFLPAGTYLLTVTDANNCTDTISETVTEPLPVPVSISVPSTTVCIGSSVNLQATGALNYSWSPPVWLNSTTSANVISTPNSSITYVLSGTDLNGCTNTDTVDIQVVQSLMMTSNPPFPEVCEGESTIINVQGASFYNWFPSSGIIQIPATPGSSFVVSPQTSTNYQVIGTDNFGCTDTIYINVDVLLKPSVSVTNSPSICEGESVSLVASGANNYNWYPSNGLNSVIGNTVTANPLVSTSYSVIGTLNNGCSDTVSTVVSVNPNPILSTQSSNIDICLGDTAILFVNGALNYIWNPILGLSSANSDTVMAYPINNTIYSIVGMDSLGCNSSTSILVNVNPLPIIDVTATKPEICIGESILLTATGGIQYSWQPFNNVLSSNIGSVVSANPIINTTFMVNAIDSNSCMSWDTISIQVNPLPILSVNNLSSIICEGENVSLIVSGANTYVWSPSLGLNTSLGNSVVASPNITTSYAITGTDNNGCFDIISSDVIVNPSPNLSLSPSSASICLGATIQIESFGASSYVWSPGFGLNTTTSNIVYANPNSSVTYNVVGTDANLCTDSIEFQLIVGIPPSVSVSPISATICEGESVTLNASGANNYSWSPSSDLSSNIGVSVVSSPVNTTDYQLIGTDVIGCTDTTNVVVSVIPLPTANIVSGGGILCSGDSAAIVVDVSGNPPWNVTYSINGVVNSVISSTNPIVILSSLEGDYTISYISDANGCSNIGSGTEYVDVINKPQASIDYNPENPNMLNPQVSFINNSIFSNTYFWQFGDNTPNSLEFNPIHTYQEDGTYNVVLLAENGPCVDTAFIQLVIDPYYALYVPNTFTPNDDGRNDNFEPKGVGIEIFEIYIYNRWGEEVFYSNDLDIVWDGGKGVAGIYTYIISVVDKTGEFHKKNGFVLIE